MRRLTATGLLLACAGACLAREYKIVESFEDGSDDNGGTNGGGTGARGGRGGNGGSTSPTGGAGGEDPETGGSAGTAEGGTGGSRGGTAGEGGTSTGGTTSEGGTSTGGTAGSAAGRGGSAGTMGGTGGRGGTGGGGAAGSGGGGKGGTGGSSATGGTGGKGGTGGASGAGTGGKGGTGGTGGGVTGAGIVHRYSFSGTNTTAVDSVGTAHGTIVGGVQSGGVVSLAGGTTDQYVQLPAGIISVHSYITIEFWASWYGGTSNWQRVFDFGTNDGGSGQQGSAGSSPYFAFTPRAQASGGACAGGTSGFPRVMFTYSGPTSETCITGVETFPMSTLTHVAVTISGTNMVLVINGTAAFPTSLPGPLTGIVDTNNWLGRSQFSADPDFAGTISEFRIYNVARNYPEINASYMAGPDNPPTQ